MDNLKIVTVKGKEYVILENVQLYDKNYYYLNEVDENENLLDNKLIVYKDIVETETTNYMEEKDLEIVEEVTNIFKIMIAKKTSN